MAVILIAAVVFSSKAGGLPGKYDEFAQCLTDKGAKFYGAFWCPHCTDQKAMFGKSVSKLPYTECSNPDRTMNQTCVDLNIKTYPTWEFADGERMEGVKTLAELAEKTSCALPTE